MNHEELCRRVSDLCDRVSTERQRLMNDHPTKTAQNDARRTGLGKLENILFTYVLSLRMMETCMLALPDWWEKCCPSVPDPDKKLWLHEYVQFIKIGLVNATFSNLESYLRVLMRAIDPAAHAGATVEFSRVYQDLLRNRLSRRMEEHVQLLDLYSCVRNATHNNGVYFHRSGSDRTVTYNGRVYEFRIGQPLDFVDYSFILELFEDVASMLFEVTSDPQVLGVDFVLDPIWQSPPDWYTSSRQQSQL